jgi:hypothetical protein
VIAQWRIARLGTGDYLLRLLKPARPKWLDERSYPNIPDELLVRKVAVRVRVRGFRVKRLALVTTLCDAEETIAAELAKVYRQRWHAEVYQPQCPSSASLYQLAA